MTIFVNPRAVHLDRLVKLLGMLGSAYAGERAAAGLKAAELVRSLNMTWHEIILAKSIAKPTSKLADTVESKLGTVLACTEPLTDWERRFVRSINGQPRLSLKQRDTLDRLYQKAVAFYEAKNGGGA
jgi:hypothetical protein